MSQKRSQVNRFSGPLERDPKSDWAIKRPSAWPFAMPALIAIVLILIYPLLYNMWISLHIDRLSINDGKFVGFTNYSDALKNGEMTGTIGRTLLFTLGSVLLSFLIGLASALALEAFPRASKIIRPILLAPWVIPGVAVAAIWLSILDPLTGLANRLIGLFGVAPVEWLTSPHWAMLCLIIVNTWKGSPFAMLMLSAGLKSIPKEVLEAANVDGASYFQVIWYVILPALRPVISVTLTLGFIWTFNYFDLAYLLTNGGPNGATTTLPYAIWEASLKYSRYDRGAAYSVLSIALTSIAIIFYLRTLKKQRSA